MMKLLQCLTLGSLATAVSAGAAALVSVDFNCTNASGPSGSFTGTGVLGGGTWNGISTTRHVTSVTTAALLDSTGTATSVVVAVATINDSWDVGNSASIDASNRGLMSDYLYLWGAQSSATITISGLAPASAWNLVLYGANGSNSGSKFTIGGVVKSTTDSGTVGATLLEGDEYVRYNALQADANGKLIITWDKVGDFSNLNGLQLETAVVTGPPNIVLPPTVNLTPDGTTQSYDVTVSNTSADNPLSITNVNFTGTDAGAFTLVTALPLNVPVNSSGTLTFAFNPAGVSGPVDAAMSVTSNDPDDSPKEVAITGYVPDPVATPVPSSLDFGEMAATDPATDLDLSIYNDGWNNDLIITSATISDVPYAAPAASRFTVQTAPAGTVAPGDSTITTIRFNPAGLAGRAVARLTLETNDPVNPTRQVMLTGVTPMAAGALSDNFDSGYASSVWDNPWDVSSFVGARAEFTGTGRNYLRSVAADFGTTDFSVTATLNRGSSTGGDGCAFFGIGTGEANPGNYSEPNTGQFIYVRYLSKGWAGELGDILTNNGQTVFGLPNSLPNAVALRMSFRAATGAATITLDTDDDGFETTDPTFTATNANLSPTDTHLFAGGAGGAWFDNVVVTLGVTDPYTDWADSWAGPALIDKTAGGDPDGDGIPNVMEYVLGGDPRVSSMDKLPQQSTAGGNLVLSYTRNDDSTSDTTQTGQWSTDLTLWHDIAPTQVNDNGAAADDMEIRIPLSNAADGKLFGRLHVSQP